MFGIAKNLSLYTYTYHTLHIHKSYLSRHPGTRAPGGAAAAAAAARAGGRIRTGRSSDRLGGRCSVCQSAPSACAARARSGAGTRGGAGKRGIRFALSKGGFARSATLGLPRKGYPAGKGATGAAKFTPRGTTYVFVNVVVAPRYVARVQPGSGGLRKKTDNPREGGEDGTPVAATTQGF